MGLHLTHNTNLDLLYTHRGTHSLSETTRGRRDDQSLAASHHCGGTGLVGRVGSSMGWFGSFGRRFEGSSAKLGLTALSL